jgi:hypothetical protein
MFQQPPLVKTINFHNPPKKFPLIQNWWKINLIFFCHPPYTIVMTFSWRNNFQTNGTTKFCLQNINEQLPRVKEERRRMNDNLA